MSDYLCEQLIVEIFTRLPPKSLLRFRSLSKSLYTCISSPGFIRMHTFRSPKKILLRHANNDDIKRAADFYTLHGEDELLLCLERGYNGITRDEFPCSTFVRIVGSCYGTFFLKINNNLSLWNPSIRHKLSVPKCPQKPNELETFPWAGIGLGFDPIGDDYKIVWISESRKSSFVYAVKTGAWCEIASPTPQFSYVLPEAVFFNGVLHWEVHCDHIKSQDIYLPSYILTFDLSTHVFGMIRLPEPDWCWRTTGLTTIQSSLALISYRMDVDDTWIRVLRDNSWYVVFKLGTDQLPIEGALQLKPQPNINDGDLLLKTFEEGVQVYNPKTRVRSRVVNFNAASYVINFFEYVETLHLLDKSTM